MFGAHGGFILAAYAATVAAVGGLVLYVLADYRAQARKLAALDATGVDRRGRRKVAPGPADRPNWDAQ